jgi:hypothetical protein
VARKTAEMLATSLNVTTTVYGTDSEGEFVYGVHEVADGAGNAASPLIKRLFVESAAASLNFKDQLITNIPEETIKGFAAMSAALGYIVREHKQAKRTTTPQISYSTLFRVFCGEGEPATISLPADDATIAILTRKLTDMPGWMWLSELAGMGIADRAVINSHLRPNKVMLNIDGELQVIAANCFPRHRAGDGSAIRYGDSATPAKRPFSRQFGGQYWACLSRAG